MTGSHPWSSRHRQSFGPGARNAARGCRDGPCFDLGGHRSGHGRLDFWSDAPEHGLTRSPITSAPEGTGDCGHTAIHPGSRSTGSLIGATIPVVVRVFRTVDRFPREGVTSDMVLIDAVADDARTSRFLAIARSGTEATASQAPILDMDCRWSGIPWASLRAGVRTVQGQGRWFRLGHPRPRSYRGRGRVDRRSGVRGWGFRQGCR